MAKKTIAFIPGAFRPFGNHHMQMVKHYSGLCDEVVIIVSNPKKEENLRKTNTGSVISAEDAKEIIDLCLEGCGLKNVTCVVSRCTNPAVSLIECMSNLENADVLIGGSDKGDDSGRFDGIRAPEGRNITIIPPEKTIFKPFEKDDVPVSATDMRKHIDDKDMLRSYLPVELETETVDKIYGILNRKKEEIEETECGYDSSFFKNILSESTLDEDDDGDEDFDEIDEEETEYSGIVLDDDEISRSDCRLIAYNTHIMEMDSEGVYNPKNNPDKAIDILFRLDDGNEIEIFLDTETKEWDSRINGSSKLTPDQMGQYFSTDFARKVDDKIYKMWPKTDPYFNDLLCAVREKKINCEPCGMVTEDGEFRKGNIDKSRSRGKNAAGEQIYTNSGRKIVTFSDFGVKHNDDERYFVWPEKSKEYKWSQWADWRKFKKILYCTFAFNSYKYGLSLSLFSEDDKNRGFRAYNLDLEPKLQYLTPIETQQILDLTIVKKFCRNALKRLNRFMSESDEEIFRKINKPEKCSLQDIKRTKHIIKNTMKAIRDRRADTYIYT